MTTNPNPNPFPSPVLVAAAEALVALDRLDLATLDAQRLADVRTTLAALREACAAARANPLRALDAAEAERDAAEHAPRKRRTTPRGVVFYEGPSALDGAPVVAIATASTVNRKTGPMVQTWILRADLDPVAASRASADASVCGACPRRHALGGDCYVTLAQAPLSVWRAWRRGRYARAELAPFVAALGRPLRAGSYGDPVAVPLDAWREAFAASPLWTCYSHQWRTASPEWRRYAMASCDTVAEAAEAAALGWRAFLAVGEAEALDVLAHGVGDRRAIMCPASGDAPRTTCARCALCAGASDRTARAPHVAIVEHGARSSGKRRRAAASE